MLPMKYLIKLKYLMILCFLLLGAYFVLPINTIPHIITVEVVDDNTTDHLKLYYNAGKGFRESDSILFKKKTLDRTTIKWTFVPRQKISALRIDPFSEGGQRLLKSLTFSIYGQEYKFTAQDIITHFKPGNSIVGFEYEDDLARIVTHGDDPYILSTIDFDSVYDQITSNNSKYTGFYLLEKSMMVVGLLLIAVILLNIKFVPTEKWPYRSIALQRAGGITFVSVCFLFFWLLAQTSFFAINVDYGVFPDERGWVELSQLYEEADGLRLQDSLETYHLGQVSAAPYLYFLTTGKMLQFVDNTLESKLYFLRFFSIACVALTFIFVFLLTKEITANKFILLSVLICISNIPMFVFISAAASYDPLANLLGVLTSYFAVLYYKSRRLINVIFSFICLLIGALTKITFLPFVLFQTLLTSLFWVYEFFAGRKLFVGYKNPLAILACVILGVLILLNLELYGTNLLKYSSVMPSQESVLGEDVARTKHMITKRDYDYSLTAHEREEIGLYDYIPKWFQIIEMRMMGIMGHENIIKPVKDLIGYRLILFLCVAGCLYHFIDVLKNKYVLYFLALSLSYGAFLFWYNYEKQTHLRVLGLVVQGRYLFPVLPQLLIALFYGLYNKTNRNISAVFLTVLVIVSLHGGIDYFLQHGGDEFFNH